MNSGEIAQIDREVAQLEDQLAALHGRRVQILQELLRDAEAKAGGSAASSPKRARPAAAAVAEAPAAAPKAKKKAGKKKAGKKSGKRSRMSTEFVEEQIVKTVKAAGSEGLSLKEISDLSGINYQTTAKKLKEMPSFQKKGKLKQARYSYKG